MKRYIKFASAMDKKYGRDFVSFLGEREVATRKTIGAKLEGRVPEYLPTDRATRPDTTAANNPDMAMMISQEQAVADRLFFNENKGDVTFMDHIARYGVRPDKPIIEDKLVNGRVLQYEASEWTDAEPLGQDVGLFAPDWDESGEAGEGMSCHLHDLSGLDRLIVEDCDNRGGKVQRLAIAVPHTPRRKDPEVLRKALGCSFTDAHRLIVAWGILDETGRTWPELKSMAIKLGFVKALEYFETLADDVQAVEYRPTELTGIDGDAPILPEVEADWIWRRTAPGKGQWEQAPPVNPVWLDKEGTEWIDSVDTSADMFQLVTINNDQGEPLTLAEHKAALKAFWARQPHPKRFAQLCIAAQRAKIADLHKIRTALKTPGKLSWLSRAQSTRLWAIVNGRRRELDVIKSQWTRKLAATMTAVERRTLTDMLAAKSVKQVGFYWHQLLSGQVAGLRPRVLEHIIKPALAKRQRQLAA